MRGVREGVALPFEFASLGRRAVVLATAGRFDLEVGELHEVSDEFGSVTKTTRRIEDDALCRVMV